MQTANRIALFALLLALILGILVGVHDVHQVLSKMPAVLSDVGGAAHAIGTTAGKIDQTISKVNTSVDTVNAAADAEKDNWQKTSKNAADTARDLRALIARFDRSFVDGTLQHFNTETLPAIDSMIVANGDQLQDTLGRLGDSADALGGAAKTLDAQLSNPQIPELLGHIDMTAMHFEKIAANSEAMSGDMRIAVHRLAQPPTKLHTALNVAWTTAKFGSLFVP